MPHTDGLGVDVAAQPDVPDGVDRDALAAYCLGLADDALVLCARLREWCARSQGKEVETLERIADDLAAQARSVLARAVALDPGLADRLAPGAPGDPVDRLAFHRALEDYRCVGLVTLRDEDVAYAVVTLAAASLWRVQLWRRLTAALDPGLAQVARIAVRQAVDHGEYAVGWVRVLADGPTEAVIRLERAWSAVAPLLLELDADPVATELAGVVPDPVEVAVTTRADWHGLGWQTGMGGEPMGRAAPAPLGRAGRHPTALADLVERLRDEALAAPGSFW